MIPRHLLAVTVAVTACTGGKGPLDEGPHCEDTPADIALDEPTPLGFTAADVLLRLPATEQVGFTWADGTETLLSLAFRPADAARFVDSEAVYPEGEQPAIGVVCDDRIEVDVSWDLATADGAFDETFDTPLGATAPEAAGMQAELDLDGLGGAFDLDDWTDETGYDERRAWVTVEVGDGATRGTVEGQISGSDDDCADGEVCTAWAAQVPVGAWGLADEA